MYILSTLGFFPGPFASCLVLYFFQPFPICQDHEMIRIFDSMVFEDEVSDDLTLGVHATGDLDAAQTRQVMYLDKRKPQGLCV